MTTRALGELDQFAEHQVAGVAGEVVDVFGGQIVGWDGGKDCVDVVRLARSSGSLAESFVRMQVRGYLPGVLVHSLPFTGILPALNLLSLAPRIPQ